MKWKIPVIYEMSGYSVIEAEGVDTKEKALEFAKANLGTLSFPVNAEEIKGTIRLNNELSVEFVPETIRLTERQIDDIVSNFSNAVEDYVLSGKLSEIKYHLNSSYDIIASVDSEIAGIYYVYIINSHNGYEICRELVSHSRNDESYLELRVKIRNILRTYCV
ncbi:MAG: hypothetical protein J6M24_00445 [Lachnospiraceae bacterium]|nr:hypothetical protein [Lachnospiraceae bacterium]